MSLEQKINYQLNKFPFIKKIIKRPYQLAMYAISPKIKSDGDIIKISPSGDGYEYFFGYYDKSPWDITDRYMLCLKANNTWKDVNPKQKADIILIDTKKDINNKDRVVKIAETNTWNVQQGCMLQWLGPDFKSKIIYNDCRDNKYVSIIYDLKNKKERVINAPVYSVSSDGKFALTLDFSRLYNLRPGYGYYNIVETTKDENLPNKTAIWKIDLETGKIDSLLKYTDFASFSPRPEMQEKNSVHKVNHIMLSPNGKRFMVLYRWFNGQRKYTRLITCNIDGTDMYLLSDDDMVSHCYWKNDDEIIAFENKKKTGPGYYLMKDKSQKYIHCWPQFSNDGHPSYSPNGKWIVTDSYPDRARIAKINIMDADETKKDNYTIAKVFAPFKYDNDTRCDLHPRWNHASNKICFDSVFEGKRGLYITTFNTNVFANTKLIGSSISNKKEEGKIKIVYLITSCKRKGPIEQTLNIIKNLDTNIFYPILITLYKEDVNGRLNEYLPYVNEHYFMDINKINILLKNTKRLNDKLKQIKPDIIHSLGLFPDLYSSRLKNIKSITTLRNFVYEDYPSKFGKFEGFVMAKLHLHAAKNINKVLTCSKSLANIYKEKLSLSFDFIQNGVDLTKFVEDNNEIRKQIRKKLKISLDDFVYIYTGQFIERKNIPFLLEAFVNKYGNSYHQKLLLLGDGPLLKELMNKYKDRKNIIFYGNVDDVKPFLYASDVYISTSKSEGLPNGVLEALAAGKPLILSNIPQHNEIMEVGENIGYTYDNKDKNDLINCFTKMEQSDLPLFSKNAKQVAVQCFSAKIMSQKYQDEYKKLGR